MVSKVTPKNKDATFILGNNNLNSNSKQMIVVGFTDPPIIKVFDSNNEVPPVLGAWLFIYRQWSSGGQTTRVR